VCDQPTYRDSSEPIEQRQHRAPHLTADIFEIDVDPIRALVTQVLPKIRSAMIEANVEAEFLSQVARLLRSAGNADHPATLELSHLTDCRADRTAGSRDDESFAGLGVADVE